MRASPCAGALLATLVLAVALVSHADEGMWTFDNPPNALMRDRYGFTASDAWLRHAQLASLRFGSGGSGSFVSNEGLVLTNHHVAQGQLQKRSTPEKDFVRDGFYARKRSEEIRCPDLELNQLRSYAEVTDSILGAIPPGASSAEAHAARTAAIAKLTKSCTEETGLRCDIVKLYQGGEFWLYRYQKYTDVRLVMAPESSAAFFGGDYDNFTYPRFALDFAFFRVYENEEPVRPEKWFAWSKAGASEGEPTFVTGHPGWTQRDRTVAQLEYERDFVLPFQQARMREKAELLKAYRARGEEESRRGHGSLFGTQNYLKAVTGMREGLDDSEIFRSKVEDESELRAAVATRADLERDYGSAWRDIESAYGNSRDRWQRDYLVLGSGYRGHTLARWAEKLVRYASEVEKPNEERLEEFADAKLESMRFRLFSSTPSYPDLEAVLLAHYLEELRTFLGPTDPLVVELLEDREPGVVAAEAAGETRVGDPDFRKLLAEGGSKAVAESDDAMIRLARIFDRHYRPVREWHDDNVSIVETLAGARIAKAKFALRGKGVYPDATFTLRLSYGKAARYELGTTLVPFRTVLGGLYARHDAFGGEAPFDLSERVAKVRGKADLSTPLNFVTTHDITGGNSGSPVINRKLEIVGLIFDSNIQGLSNEYVYSDRVARAVSVHSSGILEALESIYEMKSLAKELRR